METDLQVQAEKIMKKNQECLSSQDYPLEEMKENFDLCEKIIQEINILDKENFEKQLEQLRVKYALLIENFSEKRAKKQDLQENLKNLNESIEIYLNILRDKAENLKIIRELNQEDNELNINYEKEIRDVEERIMQKQCEMEDYERNLKSFKKEMVEKEKSKLEDLEMVNRIQGKIIVLKEKIEKKHIEIEKTCETISKLKANLREKSMSPIRSPVKRHEEAEEIFQPNLSTNKIRPNKGVKNDDPRKEIIKAKNSNWMIYAIFILTIIILYLLSKKFTKTIV